MDRIPGGLGNRSVKFVKIDLQMCITVHFFEFRHFCFSRTLGTTHPPTMVLLPTFHMANLPCQCRLLIYKGREARLLPPIHLCSPLLPV